MIQVVVVCGRVCRSPGAMIARVSQATSGAALNSSSAAPACCAATTFSGTQSRDCVPENVVAAQHAGAADDELSAAPLVACETRAIMAPGDRQTRPHTTTTWIIMPHRIIFDGLNLALEEGDRRRNLCA